MIQRLWKAVQWPTIYLEEVEQIFKSFDCIALIKQKKQRKFSLLMHFTEALYDHPSEVLAF